MLTVSVLGPVEAPLGDLAITAVPQHWALRRGLARGWQAWKGGPCSEILPDVIRNVSQLTKKMEHARTFWRLEPHGSTRRVESDRGCHKLGMLKLTNAGLEPSNLLLQHLRRTGAWSICILAVGLSTCSSALSADGASSIAPLLRGGLAI